MSKNHRRLPWRKVERWARLVKDRCGWRCQVCGLAGRLEADHIIPLEDGGDPWDLANGQSLCHTCHSEKTARENGVRGMTPEERARELAWNALLR